MNREIKTNAFAPLAQAVCGWNNNGTVWTISGKCDLFFPFETRNSADKL